MKSVGILLIIAGVIWALVAFNMGTTVTSESKTVGSGEYSIYVPSVTVNNLGLMDERRNNLMFAGLTILAGVILIGFGSISKDTNSSHLKSCPFCAERIQAAATKCRYCNSDLPHNSETLFLSETAALNKSEMLPVLIDHVRQGNADFYTYKYLITSVGGKITYIAPLGFLFDEGYLVEHQGKQTKIVRFHALQQYFLDNVIPLISKDGTSDRIANTR